jgi:hypothetical protein
LGFVDLLNWAIPGGISASEQPMFCNVSYCPLQGGNGLLGRNLWAKHDENFVPEGSLGQVRNRIALA